LKYFGVATSALGESNYEKLGLYRKECTSLLDPILFQTKKLAGQPPQLILVTGN
jgi:hypothetical protein